MLALGLAGADQARLIKFSDELREQATELERQAAAEVPRRTAEPSEDRTRNKQKLKKGRGGSNDPEPQA